MANNAEALNGLECLLREMRWTNVARGLKTNVHERWIKELEAAFNTLKENVPQLEKKAASQSLVQDVVTQIKGKGR